MSEQPTPNGWTFDICEDGSVGLQNDDLCFYIALTGMPDDRSKEILLRALGTDARQLERERDALAAQVATLRALLEDACATLKHLREAENDDARLAGRNLPWPPDFPPVPNRFTDALDAARKATQ
jgi:hypothetical protein